MKFYYRLFLSLALFSASYVKATHLSGGDITYSCVGPNQYKIQIKLFRDCAGPAMGSSLQTLTFSNSCGLPDPSIILILQDPSTGTDCAGTVVSCATDISQLCPAQMPFSSCNGGNLPGRQEYIYSGTVTLPGLCDAWTIDFNTPQRNPSVNVDGTPYFHLKTTMHTVSEPCNNSPVFTSQPIPYVCINQPVNYNYGVVETDGDSMIFSLINAMQSATAMLLIMQATQAPCPFLALPLIPIQAN